MRRPATVSDRDPFAVLHEHYRWIETCREHDVAWRNLDLVGSYTINTSVNHSEEHGPFADWRREFAVGVARDGDEADDGFLGRFGLSRALIHSVLGTSANR